MQCSTTIRPETPRLVSRLVSSLVLSGALLIVACGRDSAEERSASGRARSATPTSATAMTLTSTAFSPADTIPKRFTCDGENVSPPLAWSGAPAGTHALALICDDPDAPRGTWVHWVVANIGASLSGSLAEDVDVGDAGAVEGVNDFGDAGYGGPCPPPGKPHRYSFRLYALDGPVDLPERFDKQALIRAIEGHTLAEAELVARYGR